MLKGKNYQMKQERNNLKEKKENLGLLLEEMHLKK